jgi:hypothetical protein
MKLVKSLLLGSAAGIVAVGSAVAADLPVRKAAPVDYVQVCSAFGTGYFYIPGTDTCLRVGGYVRYQAQYGQDRWGARNGIGGSVSVNAAGTISGSAAQVTNPTSPTPTVAGHAASRGSTFSQFVRARLNLNAQTATEFGTLSSTIGINFNDNDGSTSENVDYAFIDFAGFRFGKAPSFFRTVGIPSFVGGSAFRSGEAPNPLVGYTFDAGMFSVFASVETPRNNTASTNAVAFQNGVAYTTNQKSGMPDFVGGFEFSQGDIRVKVSGALSEIRGSNRIQTGASAGNFVDTKYGYALQAGTVIGLPMIGSGTNIQIQGTYSEGAISYVNPGQAGQRFTLETADAYVDASGSFKRSKAWGIYGSLNHTWTPAVSQTLYASYGEYNAPSAVRRTFAAGDPVFNLQNDPSQFKTWAIGNIISWTPVSGLSVALDTNYTQTDAKRRILLQGQAGAANARYSKNDHVWNATLRVQRSF